MISTSLTQNNEKAVRRRRATLKTGRQYALYDFVKSLRHAKRTEYGGKRTGAFSLFVAATDDSEMLHLP